MLNIHFAKSWDSSKRLFSLSCGIFSTVVLILQFSICITAGLCRYMQCGEHRIVSEEAIPKVTSLSPSKYSICSSPSLTIYKLGSMSP